jgi:hypothetical protein
MISEIKLLYILFLRVSDNSVDLKILFGRHTALTRVVDVTFSFCVLLIIVEIPTILHGTLRKVIS